MIRCTGCVAKPIDGGADRSRRRGHLLGAHALDRGPVELHSCNIASVEEAAERPAARPEAERRLHSNRPCVYLDEWVWIRFAAARAGRAREPGDVNVLAAVQHASEAGVAFPLSSTHYVETLKKNNPRDRAEVAGLMAEVSHLRTLRSRKHLLRFQVLAAMHNLFGRPAFKPDRPEVLGVGVHWAFVGEQHQLTLYGPEQALDWTRHLLSLRDLCRLQQWQEIQFLAGPRDDQVKVLRDRYGYRPETTAEVARSRLEWEQIYAGLLLEDPVDAAELRFRVRVRELLHEHLDGLSELLSEYGLHVSRVLGDPNRSVAHNRRQLNAFVDSAPSIRLAADLKVELFRNKSSSWKVNHLHDIDAMMIAVPYCDVVVPDKEIFSLMDRTKAGERNGTIVIRHLSDLVDVLADLEGRARAIGGDHSDWDWFAPDVGFDPQPPESIWPRSA